MLKPAPQLNFVMNPGLNCRFWYCYIRRERYIPRIPRRHLTEEKPVNSGKESHDREMGKLGCASAFVGPDGRLPNYGPGSETRQAARTSHRAAAGRAIRFPSVSQTSL